jgi:hypothetical protein
MNATSYRKVISVSSTLQAVTVQNTLEMAGIPVSLARSKKDGGLDILTPEEWVVEAKGLLNCEARTGEIFMGGR